MNKKNIAVRTIVTPKFETPQNIPIAQAIKAENIPMVINND